MDKIQKIRLIVTALLLFGFGARSQQNNVIVFATDEGVHLRWDMEPNAQGYHIYRSSEGEDWTRATQTPLSVITKNSDIRAILGTKTDILLGLFGTVASRADLSLQAVFTASRDEEQFKLIKAMTLINPEFADILALRYFDPHKVPGSVQYMVKAMKADDESESTWARSGSINAHRIDVIPTIETIEGEGGDRSALLKWSKDKQALRSGEIVTYHVYRSGSDLGPFTRVNYYGILPGNVKSSSSDANVQEHADRSLENGQTYYYYVKAVNAFGMEGPPSLTVEVFTGNYDPPAPPSAIQIRQSGKAAHLTWSHDDETLKGFEISRSEDPDGGYEQVYPISGGAYSNFRNYLDFNLSPGLIYYYKIRSVNAKDIHGPWSTPMEFINWDKVPPSAPTGLIAVTGEDGKITISWETATESDVIGYHIDRATDNNYDWQFRLNMKMLKEPVYTDHRPEVSQSTYGYVVYAVDRSLNQSPASEMIKVRLPDIVAPQAPIFTGLRQAGDSVILQWTNSIEEDLDHYSVFRSTQETGPFTEIGISESNTYTDLPEGYSQYFYQVTAIDNYGNESDRSVIISLTNEASPYPDSPVNGEIILTDEKVTITWESPVDERVSGFLISRYTGSSDERKDIAQRKIGDELIFTDKYVVSGRNYQYEIRSHDKEWQLSVPLQLTIKVE